MAKQVAKEHQDRLKELKLNVESWHNYFNRNANRYHEFMRFVFDTTLSSQDIQKLTTLQKPQLEFNIIEALISRQRGEFARQEPSISVKAADGVTVQEMSDDYLEMMRILQGHMKELLLDSSSDGLQYKLMTDILGGGYTAAKVYTDYLNDMSFDHKIVIERAFDPTMCGFDPLARETHKGDGQFCFELVPWTRERFVEEFGEEKAQEIKFSRGSSGVDGFSWSYNNNSKDIVLMCEYFEKKKVKRKIVKLSTGHVVTEKHYEELLKHWNDQEFIQQAPVIVAERYTEMESIIRYIFCETHIISRDVTDFRYLPIVFIDGNSVDIRDSDQGNSYQMTRPYAYQAKGIQQMKNFFGQSLAQQAENMVMHKFKASIESIPDDYEAAYRNPQEAQVLVYNAFYNNDPSVPLQPPQEVVMTSPPPFLENIFYGSDNVTQAILGAYDSTLGTNEKDISGTAIANGAIYSSAAAAPYLMGYIHGLNRIGQILLDLIPKIYVTPRTIPIKTPDGKRSYQLINDPDNPKSINLRFKPNDLQVTVEAGVNTAIQKQVALDQITRMMQASPLFAQFMNTDGLEIILDNFDIRGVEELKVRADKFMKQLKEQQQQQAQQPDPMMEIAKGEIEVQMADVEQRKERAEGELAVATAKVAMEREKTQAQVAKIMSDIRLAHDKLGLDMDRAASDDAREAIDTALKITKEHHDRSRSEHKE